MADLAALKRTRATIKGTLTRFLNHLESLRDDAIDEFDLRARESRFEPIIDSFNDAQTAIQNLTTDLELLTAEDEERRQFEDSYYSAIAKSKRILSRIDNLQQSRASSSVRSDAVAPVTNDIAINLPKIDLPKFNGAYGDWIKFRDTFKSVIHDNTRLNQIQKFHYLNSVLTGEAVHVIESLGISEANYELAWSALCSRYEDSNSLRHFHVSGLFELPAITKESYAELRKLLDDAKSHLLALKALNEPVDAWDTLVIYLLTSKLSNGTKREWERSLMSKGDEKFALKELTEFLERHCKYLQKTQTDKTGSDAKQARSNSRGAQGNVKSFGVVTSPCALCNGAHALYACDAFKNMTPAERLNKVHELNLCFNCLGARHQNKQCSLGPCKKCGKKHNNLLHIEKSSEQSGSPRATPASLVTAPPPQRSHAMTITEQSSSDQLANEAGDETTISSNTRIFNAHSQLNTPETNNYVLLATAVINVYDNHGKMHECRALLDPCSQAHIMTTKLRNELGLTLQKTAVELTGIEGTGRTITNHASLMLKSRIYNFSSKISCLVMDKIGDNLPSVEVSHAGIELPKGITLADPFFDQSRPIDLLIGAGLYYELECSGIIRVRNDQPFFKKTLLGWIVAGNIKLPRKNNARVVCNVVKNEQLQKDLTRFWEVEHNYADRVVDNKNDVCEKHFKDTTKRDSTGRFIVSIPFKDNLFELGDSKSMAYKQLLATERKLTMRPELKEEYINFMKEYESLGHMTEIPATKTDTSTPHCYLSHLMVSKETSTTTKKRVVFHASQSTKKSDGSKGLSLNDVQYVGPTVQDDLFSIALRFRQHPYVLSADIAKMYRQILVAPEQRVMQRILWRSDFNSPIKIYELNTVTYGTASAPFLDTRCLVELADEHKDMYPKACNVLRRDFYVDDLLTGVNSIAEGNVLKNELSAILQSAGMQLRKWASNEPCILNDQSNVNAQSIALHNDKDPKTLGLLWNPNTDELEYRFNFSDTRKITKRTILSTIAQIFDPLGLVGPALIKAKIIMQKLWSLKLDWDESLPQEMRDAWTRTHDQLNDINLIHAARFIADSKYKIAEFHGFCDASEDAYGACVYVCSVDSKGERISRLLCAKSRVAPLKATSIPRLELLGAVLLAQLANKISRACDLKMDKWHFWSDSMVVLAWLKSPSNKWKTFVANRVAEVQELTNENWHHVDTKSNPADLISRGITAAELRESNLWWQGPHWLLTEKTHWPLRDEIYDDKVAEQKTNVKCFITRASEERADDPLKPSEQKIGELIDFNRFSSLSSLVRTVACVLRFIEKARLKARLARHNPIKTKKLTDNLKSISFTGSELKNALTAIVKVAQSETFANELAKLRQSKELGKSNSLIPLTPFIDSEGLLRVGGRLKNARIPFEQRHQIILTPKHAFTRVVIEGEHKRLLHAGCQTTLASLRAKFWILNGKSTVKGIIHKCMPCFRANPKELSCIMGDLPASRIVPARPFANCGVDYAGPFLIKEKARSRAAVKAYICIFVCFVTKAVHIELAADLSTDAFLNCLKRFVSRRGLCSNIYSYNGTNFVGAKNELNELSKLLTNEKFRDTVINFAALEQINWHFTPPRAPHFGGLWESAVRSAKNHLRRVVAETPLTYEELCTILTQVEACLNSRPLSPLSNDPNDLTPLTPGHFLIGDALKALPQADLTEIKVNRLNQYQKLQQTVQHFWKRWQREYLPQLQRKTKWRLQVRPLIKEGAMVIIRDDNTSPMQWPLGKIAAVHPGKDGIVRVVTVRTARGLIKRSVTKIYVLPCEQN